MEELTVFWKTRQKCNLVIVLINCLVFLVLSILGDPGNGSFMLQYGADYAPFVLEKGEYFRLFTSMFLHFSLQHLAYNMLMLIFMGDILEKHVGKLRYLAIYLGGGLAGNLLSVFWAWHTQSYAISAGASGAIFAVTGALLFYVLFRKNRIPELSGKRLVLLIVLNVLEGITAQGIDNLAHIGGLAGGFLLTALLNLERI